MARQIISDRLNCNAGIAAWYKRELLKLTKAMTSECKRVIEDIYKKGYANISLDESLSSQARIALNALQKKYGDKFSQKAKILVESLLNKSNRYANWQFNKQLKDMLGDKAKGFSLSGSAISPEKSEIMKAVLFDNTSLIKSIPSEYFKSITGAVARSIESGKGIKWLTQELTLYGAKSGRKTELMALDQTRKAYTSINLRNFKEAGIKKFKWLHSGGSRDPREYHKNVLNGKIFDIDDPPVIDIRTGERGYPGQLPNCRCVMCAVLDFDDPSPETFDEWHEDDHPRDEGGKFSTSNTSGGKFEKSSLRDKIKSKQFKPVRLSKDEYSKVMHELNTNLTKEERKKGKIKRPIGSYVYTIVNNGFNEYTIIEKEEI